MSILLEDNEKNYYDPFKTSSEVPQMQQTLFVYILLWPKRKWGEGGWRISVFWVCWVVWGLLDGLGQISDIWSLNFIIYKVMVIPKYTELHDLWAEKTEGEL